MRAASQGGGGNSGTSSDDDAKLFFVAAIQFGPQPHPGMKYPLQVTASVGLLNAMGDKDALSIQHVHEIFCECVQSRES